MPATKRKKKTNAPSTESARTTEELEMEIFILETKKAIQQAYQQGVEDGMKRFFYPPVLTKKDLMEIMQIELSTVTKVVAHPTFPKLSPVQASYPRDEVFAWIKRNTSLKSWMSLTNLMLNA
ncbi:hypothetical protein [Domibacillus tundrae]|uniref:hypothetical protein n=1 Tax=Domibacillus tundrae TaxID=1587527 RepID=UPI003391EE53